MKAYEQTERFADWLANKDLGPLEDVRPYVEMEAIQNVFDVPVSEQFDVAKFTVEMWLDDTDSAEFFNEYRKATP